MGSKKLGKQKRQPCAGSRIGSTRAFSYVLEICYLRHRAGGCIVQIPVSCDDWRASKFNLLHEAVYKYAHLVGIWMRARQAV